MKPAKSKSSLRKSLVIPGAVLMLLLSLGLIGIGYLSGNKLVNIMSEQLIRHMTTSIRDHVNIMMDAPARMLTHVQNSVERHHIALTDPDSLAAELYGLLHDEPDVDWLYFANESGGIVSNGRLDDDTQVISMTDKFQAGVFRQYKASPDGRMTGLRKSAKHFDARQKEWYKTAKETRKPYWTEAYLGSVEPVLGISLAIPVIGKDDKFIGAFGLDLILTRLSRFMGQQRLGNTGRAFLIDDGGYLIASSGGVLPVALDDKGQQQRLRPEDAADPVVRAAARHLRQHPDIVMQSRNTDMHSFIFEDAGLGRISTAIATYRLSNGNSWLIVSALPVSDFFDALRKARNISLGLVALLLLGSLAVGFWTVSHILQPLKALTGTAHVIADGGWPDVPETHRDDEIGVLAGALGDMTLKLRKAQEELVRKEKLAILGQLSGSVGHELRNPLGVMSNAVYFLKMVHADGDETTKEYLDIIKNEIENSLRIITDLLDFARTRTPQTKAVTARELTDESLGRCTIPENIELRTEITDNLPMLMVDPLQMGQVLQNLITNGIQAMPDGGVLCVAARRILNSELGVMSSDSKSKIQNSKSDGDFIAISVIDSGAGIAPENMDKLFQPLFTTKAKGIGLGLVVCKNLVEANGGKISVESASCKGTTFTVALPVERDEGVRAGVRATHLTERLN